MMNIIYSKGSKSVIIEEHYGDVNFFLGKIATAVEFWKKAALLNDISDLLKQKIKSKKYIAK